MPPCPECERLTEEVRQANLQFVACSNTLGALTHKLGPIEGLGYTDLGRWRALDTAVFAAHDRLKEIRQRAREHRRAHSGIAPATQSVKDEGKADQ